MEAQLTEEKKINQQEEQISKIRTQEQNRTVRQLAGRSIGKLCHCTAIKATLGLCSGRE